MSLKFVKIVFLLNEISEILDTLRLKHRQRIDLGPDYISCSHSNFPPNKQVSVGSVSAVTAVTPVHRLRLLLTSQHLQRPARSVPHLHQPLQHHQHLQLHQHHHHHHHKS